MVPRQSPFGKLLGSSFFRGLAVEFFTRLDCFIFCGSHVSVAMMRRAVDRIQLEGLFAGVLDVVPGAIDIRTS